MYKQITFGLMFLSSLFLTVAPTFGATVIDRGDNVNYEVLDLTEYTNNTEDIHSADREGFTSPRAVKIHDEDGLSVQQTFTRNSYTMTLTADEGTSYSKGETGTYRYLQPIELAVEIQPEEYYPNWTYTNENYKRKKGRFGYIFNKIDGPVTTTEHAVSFKMPAKNITEHINATKYTGDSQACTWFTETTSYSKTGSQEVSKTYGSGSTVRNAVQDAAYNSELQSLTRMNYSQLYQALRNRIYSTGTYYINGVLVQCKKKSSSSGKNSGKNSGRYDYDYGYGSSGYKIGVYGTQYVFSATGRDKHGSVTYTGTATDANSSKGNTTTIKQAWIPDYDDNFRVKATNTSNGTGASVTGRQGYVQVGTPLDICCPTQDHCHTTGWLGNPYGGNGAYRYMQNHSQIFGGWKGTDPTSGRSITKSMPARDVIVTCNTYWSGISNCCGQTHHLVDDIPSYTGNLKWYGYWSGNSKHNQVLHNDRSKEDYWYRSSSTSPTCYFGCSISIDGKGFKGGSAWIEYNGTTLASGKDKSGSFTWGKHEDYWQ